jgi:hypothetical protein
LAITIARAERRWKIQKAMSEPKTKGGKANGSAPSSTEKWSYEKIEDLPEEQDYFAKKLPQHLMVDDPSLNWFQKPHTITVMAIALIVLIFGAFTREGTETVANVKLYDSHLFSL